MLLLVTSASGANGNGFGALLAFELDGTFRGTSLVLLPTGWSTASPAMKL